MKKSLIQDYLITFQSAAGKEVLKDLRKRCPLVDGAVDTSNGIDVNKLLFLEGQRSVLVHIFKTLKTDPYAEQQKRAINKGE